MLFEHECFAYPKAIVAENAIEQDRELQTEMNIQRINQIERECSWDFKFHLEPIFSTWQCS